jgi:hypothetical protein
MCERRKSAVTSVATVPGEPQGVVFHRFYRFIASHIVSHPPKHFISQEPEYRIGRAFSAETRV